MSGCYPENTFPNCIHGVPLKSECLNCSNEHRLVLIESQIKTLTAMYKEISCNVAGFIDYKLRQIDENKENNKNIDSLIKINKSLLERIEKLENKINILGNISNGVKRAITYVQNNDGLRPNKCPVCEGKGRLYPDKLEVGMTWDIRANNQVCDSCNGKGILWG